MKILCLYNNECAMELFAWLKQQNNECVLWDKRLELGWVAGQKFDLAISYTYSYIVKKDIIDCLHGNIVNLHTSYLPWNKGSDPNMWSLIENTPRGVTLHYINEMLDQGDIIVQELVNEYDDNEYTLQSTYETLHIAALSLFRKAYKYYRYWPEMRKRMPTNGSYHSDKQGRVLREIVTTFNMPVEEFIKKYNQKTGR